MTRVRKGSGSISKGGCIDNTEDIAERANRTAENHSYVGESGARVDLGASCFGAEKEGTHPMS